MAAIELRAAQRLTEVRADADEQMAREFIKSVAHINVGKREHSSPDQIRFTVDSQQDFERARTALISRYGLADTKLTVYGSRAGRWFLDDSKTQIISLDDARHGGGVQKEPYSITLLDTTHKESIHQLLRRVIGPPDTTKKKL